MPTTSPATVTEDRVLLVGDQRYALIEVFTDQPSGLPFLIKSPGMMRRYIDLCETLAPERVMELGIFTGTSAAVFADLCPGAKLVAIELNADPAPFLSDFIDRNDRQDSLRPYYGVDQADAARLAAIVAAEFGDEPLDLVIDDASHLLEPTRASFEALFPRVRPGGVYVIEDWECDQRFAALRPDLLSADAEREPAPASDAALFAQAGINTDPSRPLIRLILELVLTAATSADVVAGLVVNEYTVQVQRGPAPLDPATFRLEDHYHDHLGLLPR